MVIATSGLPLYARANEQQAKFRRGFAALRAIHMTTPIARDPGRVMLATMTPRATWYAGLSLRQQHVLDNNEPLGEQYAPRQSCPN